MRRFLSTVAIVFTLSGTAHAQDYQKGLPAYDAGDYATALQEWKPPAEQGDADAQYTVGLMYAQGQGVPHYYQEAAGWFRKAAEQGDAEARARLGYIHREGQGVIQDYKEAVKWYRLVALQRHAMGQVNLGNMYGTGLGVPQDYLLAHMWSNIGSANGNENGAKNRDIAANLMTAEDISKAQAMARECMASDYQNCGD